VDQSPLLHHLRMAPLARLALPLVAGLMLEFALESGWAGYGILAGLFLGAFALMASLAWLRREEYGWRWVAGAALVLGLFFLGGLQAERALRPSGFEGLEPGREVLALGVLEEPLQEKARSFKTVMRLEAFADSAGRWVPCQGQAVVYMAKDSSLAGFRFGDRVVARARFELVGQAGNPNEFDYRRFLARRGILRQIYLRPGQVELASRDNAPALLALAHRWRRALLDIYLRNGIEGQEYAVAAALTLGDRGDLDADTQRAYMVSGATHILSVSGLHVGIVAMVFGFVLDKLLQAFRPDSAARRWGKASGIIALLWVYALLTGLSPSVLRAATMFSMVALGQAFGRSMSVYNSLAASALLLMALNPAVVLDVGFQLSYVAVFAIVFLQPKLAQFWQPRSKAALWAWQLMVVSVAAQMGTAPLSLLYFHQFPNYFWLTNLVAIPLSTLVVVGGMVLLAASFWTPLAAALAWALQKVLWLLNASVLAIEALPHSSTTRIPWETWDMALGFLLVLALGGWLGKAGPRWLAASLAIAIVLVGGRGLRRWNNSQEVHAVVFNTRGAGGINFLAPGRNIVWADTAMFADPKTLSFAAEGLWTSLASPDPERLHAADTAGAWQPAALDFAGKRFLRVADVAFAEFRPDTPARVDVLVLGRDLRLDMPALVRRVRFEHLVFEPTSRQATLDAWKRECDSLGIAYHDVREQGAFWLRW